MAEKKGLRFDPAVEHLISDPDAVCVSGLIGRSERDGHVRVYTTPDLKTWMEVREDQILRHEELEDQGSRLWLKDGASVQMVTTSRLKAQNGFLQGRLASAHLGAAAPSAPVGLVNDAGPMGTVTPECTYPSCMSCSCTCTCTCTCRTCPGANGPVNAGGPMVQMPFTDSVVTCTVTCSCTCTPTCSCTCSCWTCPGANGLNAGNQRLGADTNTQVDCTFYCTATCPPTTALGCPTAVPMCPPVTFRCANGGNITVTMNPQARLTPRQVDPSNTTRRNT